MSCRCGSIQNYALPSRHEPKPTQRRQVRSYDKHSAASSTSPEHHMTRMRETAPVGEVGDQHRPGLWHRRLSPSQRSAADRRRIIRRMGASLALRVHDHSHQPAGGLANGRGLADHSISSGSRVINVVVAADLPRWLLPPRRFVAFGMQRTTSSGPAELKRHIEALLDPRP